MRQSANFVSKNFKLYQSVRLSGWKLDTRHVAWAGRSFGPGASSQSTDRYFTALTLRATGMKRSLNLFALKLQKLRSLNRINSTSL